MPLPVPRRLVLSAALIGAACSDPGSPGPQPRLSLSAGSRMLSIRDDSALVSADSVAVAISGPDATTARWVAAHGDSAAWVTLGTTSGAGGGVLRWTRSAVGLWPGVYVDTITVTLRTADSTTVRLVDTLEVRGAPEQYISRRRAWRAGERDSMIAAIVQRRLWTFPYVGDISDLAPLAIPRWDSVTEVIVNPEWRPPSAPAAREAMLYDASFTVSGLDLWIVFDSLPDVAGVQRDSLTWKMFLWTKADSSWRWNGFVVSATAANTFTPYRTIKTIDFDNSGGHASQGAGELRLRPDSATYWRGDNGGYRLTANGGYTDTSEVTTGVFIGASLQVGLMSGNVKNLILNRISGTTLPTSQNITAAWSNVPAQRIRCYFVPLTSPDGYQCTGSAFGRILANLRVLRAAAMATGRPGPR